MKRAFTTLWVVVLGLWSVTAPAQPAQINIHADQVQHRVSRYLTGACLEDVNHEVYGGIDSQMIFGESFAEPGAQPPLQGVKVYGGQWVPADDGSLHAAGGDGPKLVLNEVVTDDAEVSVDLCFTGQTNGNAGLILKVNQAGAGADHFNGYEVSLEPTGILVLGRHRQNWEPLRRVPCELTFGQWATLRARMEGKTLEIFANDKSLIRFEDTEHPLPAGLVGLRTWQLDARFRNLSIHAGDRRRTVPFAYAEKGGWGRNVSAMWRPVRKGNATGEFSLETHKPFVGRQCQRIAFLSGTGEVGVGNQGLNRWGMSFVKGQPYEGYIWARADAPTEVFAALESRDGAVRYVERRLKVRAGDWQRLDFELKPNTTDSAGRFVLKLKAPGAVSLGYAFLQPGGWGRFKNLPVRKDVAEALVDQGVTALRYGGSMVNAAEYRWKKMIGPRASRPPYQGMWYPHSSNGWGILDFLDFCEAAGFLAVPAVNVDETPKDMADFIEYVNGPADSEWGRKRAQSGHPQPYRLKHLEIGNEEKVNENYFQKFKAIAEAVWARDPDLILVVGDFCYHQPIVDPFNFGGADGGITSLAAQQQILQLAKQHGREVWFDLHVWTDGPRPDFGGTFTYIDALDKLADGAKHRVVIFEFNAGNHAQRRALANAAAINAVERDGRLPIAVSANCLQPDGQNDNGWDQGLLFLNPSQVWLQPPGYVTRMFSRNFQPLLSKSLVQSPGEVLDVTAKRSEDGRTLVLQVVNAGEQPVPANLQIKGFAPAKPKAQVEELAGPLHSANTATAPSRLKPYSYAWPHGLNNGQTTFTFVPCSITVLRFE